MSYLLKEIHEIKSDKKALRSFGITVGAVLLLLACLFHLKDNARVAYALGLTGGGLIMLGLLRPGLLKYLQKAWMTLALLMGWVMTRVILSACFFLVLTPTGLICRLLGKSFMSLKFDASAKSYWIIYKKNKTGRHPYETQY